MPDEAIREPVLARLRAELRAMYGDNLERAVLYGSRARGDAQAGSDYDVAVFLKSMPDRWDELDKLADLRQKLLDETGEFLDLKPWRSATLGESLPIMGEIRREGVEL